MVSNRYAETRIHIRDNEASVQRKGSDDMCFKLVNTEAAIGLSQYMIRNKEFTSRYILMEQNIYIDDISSSDAFYFMYNIANVDITGVAIYKDNTVKLSGVQVDDFTFHEKTGIILSYILIL